MSNSVDPDETAHMSRLIWIYAVRKSLLYITVAVKELKPIVKMSSIVTLFSYVPSAILFTVVHEV